MHEHHHVWLHVAAVIALGAVVAIAAKPQRARDTSNINFHSGPAASAPIINLPYRTATPLRAR